MTPLFCLNFISTCSAGFETASVKHTAPVCRIRIHNSRLEPRMLVQSVTRAAAALSLLVAPVAAQGTLGAYAPAAAKYRMTSIQKTSQTMMGQDQQFETTTNQLLSLAVAKAGDALTLTMTLDSATVTSTAPTGAPDVSEAIGLKFTGGMALDGKVASSQVTDKLGGPSTSPFATNMRSILPRLRIGAAKGATWVDSITSVGKQGDADITSETVVNYTLAGDTAVAGARAWKVVGIAATKLTGKGNRMGADYTIAGDVKGTITSVVSAAGVLLGQFSESDSNLTVEVEAAGMTIPIAQHATVRVDKVP
jgi:hypothetical protein